jgi:hypothetical protein
MNKWLFASGVGITLVGMIYLFEYYTFLLICNSTLCPFQTGLHQEISLLVPLGLAVIGYSFRRKGRTRPASPWPTGVQPSRALPIAIAVVLSIGAVASYPFAPPSSGSVCARQVLNGSIVDPAGGRITLSNGSVVAITKFPCSMTSVVLGTNGIAAIVQYLPFALVFVAAIVLLYSFARKREKTDADGLAILRRVRFRRDSNPGVRYLNSSVALKFHCDELNRYHTTKTRLENTQATESATSETPSFGLHDGKHTLTRSRKRDSCATGTRVFSLHSAIQ